MQTTYRAPLSKVLGAGNTRKNSAANSIECETTSVKIPAMARSTSHQRRRHHSVRSPSRYRKRRSSSATSKSSRSSSGWSSRAPMSSSERRSMSSRCFLLPKERKYPICDKRSGKHDCKGILAAAQRANINVTRRAGGSDHVKALRRALAAAKRFGCEWRKTTRYPEAFERTLRRNRSSRRRR